MSHRAGTVLAVGLLNRMWGSKQDRFARRVLAAITTGAPASSPADGSAGAVEAWYDPDEFAIHYRRRPDENPATAYLQNLYREAAEDSRSEQRERIEHFVQALVFAPELPSEWDHVAPLLRPVLRPGTFGLGMGRGLVLQSRPAGVPFLAEYVVIDQPASMAYVTTNHHDVWGVTAQQVFDTARRNLAADGPDLAGAEAGGHTLLRLLESGDSYWPSRLLLCGGLAELSARVGGRPVTFVPDTTGVFVTADDPGRIAGVFSFIEQEYRQAARPISPQGYVLDEAGHPAVYAPPPDTPAAAAVHKAALLLAAAEYESQGSALSDSEEAFPAKLILAEGDERVFTVASWADGVDTLLPRAEYIAFSGVTGEPFLATWDSVMAEAPLAPVQGLRPERFRARTWPAPDAMARLRATAVQL